MHAARTLSACSTDTEWLRVALVNRRLICLRMLGDYRFSFERLVKQLFSAPSTLLRLLVSRLETRLVPSRRDGTFFPLMDSSCTGDIAPHRPQSHHCLLRECELCAALHTRLHCTAPYCILLFCTALHCTVLYCSVLCCASLYCTVLYCTALHCPIQYCTGLHRVLLYCIVLHCTALRCTARVSYLKRHQSYHRSYI